MKKTRGITLIALVITIIVLLILAGITISSISGDDGILGRAKDAKEDTEAGQEKELVYMAANSAKLNNVEEYGIITEENLEIELDKVLGKRDEKYTLTKEEDNYIVTCLDSGRSYIIESSGIINGIEKVEPTNIDDWEYELDTETQTAVITKYKGTDTEVIIPNYIEDYRVVAIEPKGDCGLWDKSLCVATAQSGYNCNYFQNTITKIVVSEGIETIGAKSFWYSVTLQECIIKKGTKVIGDYAFYYCAQLNNIEMPDTLEIIGSRVFYYTPGLISVVIPNSVSTVGDYTFWYTYGLNSLYIPKSVINVETNSFNSANDNLIIYYEGTEEEWTNLNITINSKNTVEYNYTVQ